MTVAGYRRQRWEAERRRVLAATLAASKQEREEASRRERAARSSAAWAVKNHLPPDRIYEPQPRVMFPSNFGGLRPRPSSYEEDRRVDKILDSIRS